MDDDDYQMALWRAMRGYDVDPTKVRYPNWKALDRAGWRPETTMGTPAPKKVRLPVEAEVTPTPAPLVWHYIKIPEESDDDKQDQE